MKIVYYLTPSSFCFGVKRSIDQLEDIVLHHPKEQIFCVHALVHNPKVTKEFEKKGVIFVETIEEIPYSTAIVVFSAHGTNRQVLTKARQKFKAVYNLECPFVSKIYAEIDGFIRQGITTFFYVGKEHHQEGKNVLAYIESQGWISYVFQDTASIPQIDTATKIAVLSQTTLNFSHVQEIFHEIKQQYSQATLPTTSDVCKATYERQEVVLQNLKKFETFIVIGGKESNNTRELYNIGIKNKKKSLYGESLDDILKYPKEELFAHDTVAITWGASTPIEDIKEVFDYYKNHGYEPKMLELQ